jgi:hypothetical protein
MIKLAMDKGNHRAKEFLLMNDLIAKNNNFINDTSNIYYVENRIVVEDFDDSGRD